MPFTSNKVDYDEVMTILKQYDKEEYEGEYIEVKDNGDLLKALNDYFSPTRYSTASVLGIDIYKYASLDEFQQRLIPILFKWLYKDAVATTLRNESFLFQGYTASDFESAFISTGDGGFQIFPTPVHSLVFAIYFQAALKSFNGYANYPMIRQFLGETSLRYCLTVGALFSFDGSYFGPSIINNARLLTKDRLNRFLIDSNCENWFAIKTQGLETLSQYSYERLAEISIFASYDRSFLKERNVIFKLVPLAPRRNGISTLNSLKIGKLQLKDRTLDVYSVYLQTMFEVTAVGNSKKYDLVVSLGNLNTTGITDA
jgi:hypothetical protein